MTSPTLPQARTCTACGTEIAASLLACPGCRALVHRDALEWRATRARMAEERGDVHAALGEWREALPLLPPDARQRTVIEERIAALGRQADEIADRGAGGDDAAGKAKPVHLRLWGGLAALALFAIGKGKFLLAGLTKLPTLLSMFAAFALYWSVFGWAWAAGTVACIYVHEIGHVAVLARYGVRSTALMFVPGLGAYVTWKQRLGDPRQEAMVALGGPVWGTGAGLVALALARILDVPVLGAIAATAGAINLLNLLPIPPLDGSHAFRVLARWQRLLLGVGLLAAWWTFDANWAGLLGAVLTGFALFTAPPKEPDHEALAWFAVTAAVLTWLSTTYPMLPDAAKG
jgi:Zn-dependent protease